TRPTVLMNVSELVRMRLQQAGRLKHWGILHSSAASFVVNTPNLKHMLVCVMGPLIVTVRFVRWPGPSGGDNHSSPGVKPTPAGALDSESRVSGLLFRLVTQNV